MREQGFVAWSIMNAAPRRSQRIAELAVAVKRCYRWFRSRYKLRTALQRALALVDDIPIGRKFDPESQCLGLMQRWYTSQPTQRIVVSVLELASPISDEALAEAVIALSTRHQSALGVCEARTPEVLRIGPPSAADAPPCSHANAQDVWELTALAQKYERYAHGRTAAVEVSNVGIVRNVPSGAAIWLTQGAHYHAALFVLTVATSDSDGALRCCLSYPAPLVDRERATRFMNAFERRLTGMNLPV